MTWRIEYVLDGDIVFSVVLDSFAEASKLLGNAMQRRARRSKHSPIDSEHLRSAAFTLRTANFDQEFLWLSVSGRSCVELSRNKSDQTANSKNVAKKQLQLLSKQFEEAGHSEVPAQVEVTSEVDPVLLGDKFSIGR